MLHDKATTSQPLALIRAGSRGGGRDSEPHFGSWGGGWTWPAAPPSPSEPLVLHRDPHGAGAEGEHGPGGVLPEGGGTAEERGARKKFGSHRLRGSPPAPCLPKRDVASHLGTPITTERFNF